jgi:hypothetical protein
LVSLIVALVFGVAWSVTHGTGGGIRDAAGHISAPWLLLPLLGSGFAASHRPILGAFVGLTTTLVALNGYCFTNAFVLDLGPHTTMQDIALTTRAIGDMWFTYGIVIGLGCGAAGSWLAARY